jgi:hypothetical protein
VFGTSITARTDLNAIYLKKPGSNLIVTQGGDVTVTLIGVGMTIDPFAFKFTICPPMQNGAPIFQRAPFSFSVYTTLENKVACDHGRHTLQQDVEIGCAVTVYIAQHKAVCAVGGKAQITR